MTTNQKGAIAEAKIIARLAELGERVLIPFGRVGRYDIGLDREDGFVRVECKLARFKNGCLVFNTASCGGYRNRPRKNYSKDADYFGVWSPKNDAVYLIPVKDASVGSMCLRIDTSKQPNRNGIKWAKNFEI